MLEAFSDATPGSACAGALTQPTRRVDELQPAGRRLDRPTANGPWTVTADGWWPWGHRPDQRPDLPPVTGRLAARAPLGLPVATDGVPGQRAAAPLDVPAIPRVRAGVGPRGRLSVGACQRAALQPRALLHAGGDDSLGPLSECPRPPLLLAADLAPVWAGAQALTVSPRAPPGGPSQRSAAGVERLESVTAEVAGPPPGWRERRLVVRSLALAQAGQRGLRARLAQAQAAVSALNTRGRGPRRYAAPSALRQAVAAILARSRGPDLWPVRAQAPWWAPPWRRYGGRDATVRLAWAVQVTARLDAEAGATAGRQLGWRV